jgi:hypothetical protein
MPLYKAAGTATVLFLLVAGTAQSPAGPTPASGKRFPRTCQQIKILPDGMSDLSVTSPDGKYTVCVKEDREDKDELYTYTSVYLSHLGRLRTLGRYKDVTESSVLLWAPDSRAFAWNLTYGGASSGWTTMVFDFRSGSFREIDGIVSKDFHRRLLKACKKDWTDDNSYLLQWIGNRSILIAVEAHPGGLDCRRPVPTDFYQVAVPSGRIIKRLQGAEQEAAKKQFPFY